MSSALATPVPVRDLQQTARLYQRPAELSIAALEHALALDAGDHLVIDDPISGPRSVALEYEPVMVGRSAQADVRLEGPLISRRHAMLRCGEDGGWEIHDERSLNGLWCNGTRITGDGWHPLASGDVLNLGDWTALFVRQSE